MKIINDINKFQIGTIFSGDVNHMRFIVKDIVEDIYYHRQGGAAYNRGKKAIIYCFDNGKTYKEPLSRLSRSLLTIENSPAI